MKKFFVEKVTQKAVQKALIYEGYFLNGTLQSEMKSIQ